MTLSDRIASLQRRADARKGKPCYLAPLARLRDAKLAALANRAEQSSVLPPAQFEAFKEDVERPGKFIPGLAALANGGE